MIVKFKTIYREVKKNRLFFSFFIFMVLLLRLSLKEKKNLSLILLSLQLVFVHIRRIVIFIDGIKSAQPHLTTHCLFRTIYMNHID